MKTKDLSASTARVLATLLVVFGHGLKRYGNWHYIYSFHMAFFFLLSGYVFALAYLSDLPKISLREFAWNRFQRLIIPFLFVKFFVINPINVWTGEYTWKSTAVLIQVDHLWYLMDLFVITMFVMLAMKAGNFLFGNINRTSIGIMLILVAVSFLSSCLPSGGKSSVEGIYYYSAFFAFGILIKRFNLLKYLRTYSFISLLAGFGIWEGTEVGYIDANSITNFLMALLSAVGWFGICKIFGGRFSNTKFFTVTESYSMPIYLFHIPIMYCFDRKFVLTIHPILAIIVLFFISYSLSVAIGIFFRRIKLQILIGG